MSASYTSGRPSYSCRHPTSWASSRRSYTVSSTPCHGAWTSAPLSAHLSIECKCMASQIETPICTRRTTTHRFIWQQQHTCGAVGGSPTEDGVVGQHYTRLHTFIPNTGTHPPGMTSQEQRGSGWTASAPVSDVPFLLVQLGYGLLWDQWVWRRKTNRRPFCPPMSNPSTFSWTTRPDGSGRWDNRMAAQRLI